MGECGVTHEACGISEFVLVVGTRGQKGLDEEGRGDIALFRWDTVLNMPLNIV